MDEIINRLIASIDANTEAHGGTPPGKTKPAATASTPAVTAGKTKPASGLAKVTPEVFKATMIALKDAKGKDAAVKLLKSIAKANTMAEVKPSFYPALVEAAKAAMAEDEPAEEEGEEPDEDEL